MNIVKFHTKYDRRCFSSADVACEWFRNSPVDNMTWKCGHVTSLPTSYGFPGFSQTPIKLTYFLYKLYVHGCICKDMQHKSVRIHIDLCSLLCQTLLIVENDVCINHNSSTYRARIGLGVDTELRKEVMVWLVLASSNFTFNLGVIFAVKLKMINL